MIVYKLREWGCHEPMAQYALPPAELKALEHDVLAKVVMLLNQSAVSNAQPCCLRVTVGVEILGVEKTPETDPYRQVETLPPAKTGPSPVTGW